MNLDGLWLSDITEHPDGWRQGASRGRARRLGIDYETTHAA
jgi:hypothetical protein